MNNHKKQNLSDPLAGAVLWRMLPCGGGTAPHLCHQLFIHISWHGFPDGAEHESVQGNCILTLQALMKGFI